MFHGSLPRRVLTAGVWLTEFPQIFFTSCSLELLNWQTCHGTMMDALLEKDLDTIVWQLHDGIILSECMTSLNPCWWLWSFCCFWGMTIQTKSDRFFNNFFCINLWHFETELKYSVLTVLRQIGSHFFYFLLKYWQVSPESQFS